MKKCIGIRHEDKYLMERRVAIVPNDIKYLIKNNNIQFCVESSEKRIFRDAEFINSGAKIVQSLDNCDIIFGVKEIPLDKIVANKTYIFFSHVIKGQSYNMPMLKKMMENKCNLIDYERIVDTNGNRIIFFGRFAGIAGMINTLWSLGERYKSKGISTPFLNIKQSHTYKSLDLAIEDVKKTAEEIKTKGLPDEILPFITAFTGYGNVGKGSWEIFDLLPHKLITPEEILTAKPDKHSLYKVVFKEGDLVKRNEGEFELSHYYSNPENYSNIFDKYLPYISCLVNGMYWDERYPRILTKSKIKELYNSNNLKLCVVGDISCDPDGSIEITHKGTEIENPVFAYNPETNSPSEGFNGNGILVMAVDILPSELPRESSEAFSKALTKFIPSIYSTDFSLEFNKLDLVEPIKKALILQNGKLTPDYLYLSEFL
jgi:alpha-aminoadipic semialdehyde synthase